MAQTAFASNRLGDQPSAYLKSAAHQPVQWYPWSDEAFAKARELDRPILLDIGAVWCHWCHVMDGESYENPETAKIINEHFVAIKVDRDERPDVDRRYQEAVSALSGQGGWPLTAFLTPNGQVFFGGTYFPPVDRYGRRGFPSILLQVAEYYRTNRDSVLASARQLTQAVAAQADKATPGELSESLLDQAVGRILSAHDPVNGGFGGAPKFPHASTVEFLINRKFHHPDVSIEDAIRRTLTRMARGGVYDQIGGGFHRYSTDERWIVPHFEKMLYDNTELLRNYAMAAAMFGDSLFESTARGIGIFLLEVLSDKELGGFYTSQDADVGLQDDGDYFTWTLEELKSTCTPEESRTLAEHFHILEHGEMHHNPAKNVLFVSADFDVIAAKLGLPETQVMRLFQSGAAKLRAARGQRETPFIDRAIYASWNGMAVSACLHAADLLEIAELSDFGLKTLFRLKSECVLPDGRVRHSLGQDHPAGLLEDGVFVSRALLDGFEHTGNPEYLSAARQIADDLIARLWDDATGGFNDLSLDHAAIGLLTQPRKPIQDAPSPSANAVAVEVLCRLSDLTGEERYRELAKKTLTAFAGMAPNLGTFGGTYFVALDRFLRGSSMAVVVGDRADTKGEALWTTARKTFRPYKSLLRLESGPSVATALPDALAAMITSKKTMGYFCSENACAMPTEKPEQFAKAISRFGL